MSLLDQIDALREEAARLAKASREALATEVRDYRLTLEAVEKQIEHKLMIYIGYPDCPFQPCPGKLEPTPTKYVWKCPRCAATALPGRMESRVM